MRVNTRYMNSTGCTSSNTVQPVGLLETIWSGLQAALNKDWRAAGTAEVLLPFHTDGSKYSCDDQIPGLDASAQKSVLLLFSSRYLLRAVCVLFTLDGVSTMMMLCPTGRNKGAGKFGRFCLSTNDNHFSDPIIPVTC